jgi:hypothetical protein
LRAELQTRRELKPRRDLVGKLGSGAERDQDLLVLCERKQARVA